MLSHVQGCAVQGADSCLCENTNCFGYHVLDKGGGNEGGSGREWELETTRKGETGMARGNRPRAQEERIPRREGMEAGSKRGEWCTRSQHCRFMCSLDRMRFVKDDELPIDRIEPVMDLVVARVAAHDDLQLTTLHGTQDLLLALPITDSDFKVCPRQ